MATSKTQIFNLALLPVGVKKVTSDTEDSNAARTLNTLYDQILDEALASCPQKGWKFANTRVSVSVDANAPAFEYDYRFSVPPNCIKVISVQVSGLELTDWIKEGNYILTNLESSSVDIVYVSRVTLVGLFPPHFTKVLYNLLAMSSSYYLTQQAGLSGQLEQKYRLSILPKAQADDAGEQYVKETNTDWVDAGHTG